MNRRERLDAQWAATDAKPHGWKDRTIERTAEEADPFLMRLLDFAVPFWVVRVSDMTPEQREKRAHELGRALTLPEVAAVADPAIHAPRGSLANTFNALAEGLAIGALQPDGVTFGGIHWEMLPGGLTVRKVCHAS